MSTMTLDDGVDGGESQADAARLGGEVGVEYLLQHLFRHAAPLVGEREPYVSAGREQQAVFRLEHQVRPFNGERSAPRHCLDGIEGDIVEHLAHLPFIRFDVMEAIGNFNDRFDVCTP